MSPEGKAQLAAVADRIAGHLNKIAECFKPGVKVTVIVRDPAFPDGRRNLCLTDDTFPDVLEALRIAETQKDETR